MVEKEGPLLPSTDLNVGDVISRQILCCHISTPICEAARMMWESQASSMVAIHEGVVEGIWTESDALKLDKAEILSEEPISTVMSHPVKMIGEDALLEDASLEMQMSKVRHLLVTDAEGWPVGLLSQTDVVRSHGIEHDLMLRRVGALVAEKLYWVSSQASVVEAARLMRETKVDALAVNYPDGGEPGIFTERDYLRVLARGELDGPVSEDATRPLITVPEDTSLLNARGIFESRHFRHLGVTRGEQNELIGILSFNEIILSIERDYVAQLREALKSRDLALKSSQSHLYLAQQVIDASRDGIMVTDSNGVIQSVNPAFTTITGYSEREAVGNTPAILKSGRHDKEFYRRMWEAVRFEGHWAGEVWNRRKDGEIYPEWLSINAIYDQDGAIIKLAAIISDITDRKKSEEQIKSLAYFDVLTGLPNRRLFNDRLSMALANAHRHHHMLGIIFLDLDLFKRINDTLGHSIGDELLKQLSARLSACLREGDTAARMGGDEFTILLQEIESQETATAIAQRLNEVISKPFDIQGNTLYITASIGISIYPDDGLDVETLLQNADTAMYQVKDIGRNSYQLYAADMSELSREHLSIENSLRQAICDQLMMLMYQPKVDLKTGRIIGVEALVRWQDPELGWVSPATFIPITERIGMIGELGDWVLKTAAQQCRQWVEQGYEDLRMAVNVSALQLQHESFPDKVLKLLDESRLLPDHLELELTESVFMDRLDRLVPMLTQLKDRGIDISIDDFGTGYSSFSYLKRIPINKLKIDYSFVRDIPQDKDACEIAAAIIAMAHKLKLTVIAEGVESFEQMEFLRANDCDEVQGYYLAKPMLADKIEALLERGIDLNTGAPPSSSEADAKARQN